MTRYGTSFETIYVGTLELGGEFQLTPRVALTGLVPLATSYKNKGGHGYGLRNVTLGARLELPSNRGRWAVLTSVSAPTGTKDLGTGAHARHVSTAELTRDAGLYLPDTTTVRFEGRGSFALGRKLGLHGRAGAHAWLASGDEGMGNQIIVPLEIVSTYALGPQWVTHAAFTTLVNLFQDSETCLHAVGIGLARRGASSSFGAGLQLPLDESLRKLGMVTTSFHFAHTF